VDRRRLRRAVRRLAAASCDARGVGQCGGGSAGAYDIITPATATRRTRELPQLLLDEDSRWRSWRTPSYSVDPADIEQRDSATKVLVPYARYVELWNLAHPDKKIGDQVATAKFSFAGASYEVVLEDAEHVVLRGSLDMELFTDDPLDVPWP
jgi:hypothetical protein